MVIGKWFRKQMLVISLALSNVEKSSLRISSEEIPSNDGMTQDKKQGMLSNDLLQGILTQEVITLRARMYKVLQEADNYSYKTGETKYVVGNIVDSRIKGEPSDDYKVEMIVSNERISTSVSDSADDIDTKQEVPILITRNITPRFKIEDYAKKLYIKNIDGDTKLLEFFISKYVDIYDKKTTFLINNIKKSMVNPRVSDLLDITGVVFITNNTLGSKNFLEYQYEVIKFDKIVDFDGNYVIKFICKPTVNGVNTIEQYSDEELDKKYDNKEIRTNKH